MKNTCIWTWMVLAVACASAGATELITDDLTVEGALRVERFAGYNVPTNGLRLYFTYDDDSGSTVIDSSETGGDGTATGISYQDSFKGDAAKFSSYSTYVLTSGGDLNMNGWTGLTVSCWVRVDGWTTYGRMDELMVYDRALSVEEFQNLYDYQNTCEPAATTGGEADFNEGIRYVKPLGDIVMGSYTNRP